MYFVIYLTQLFFHCYRGGAENGRLRVSSLPGRRVALGNNRHRLHHEAQATHAGGGVQVRQEREADHLAELQLHGPAPRAGARPEGCRRYVREPLGPLRRVQTPSMPSVPLDSPTQRRSFVGLQRLVHKNTRNLFFYN